MKASELISKFKVLVDKVGDATIVITDVNMGTRGTVRSADIYLNSDGLFDDRIIELGTKLSRLEGEDLLKKHN